MFPENQISNVPAPSPFVVTKKTSPLVDRHLGGIGLNDTTKGLLYQVWEMRYLGSQFLISAPESPEEVVHTVQGVTEFSFAFDQNMQPCIAYVLGSAVFFWRFDSVLGDYLTTNYGNGVRSPRVRLDDGRASQLAENDVTLCYLEGNELVYRLQRNRYGIRYVAATNVGDEDVLVDAGMSQGNRFQFEVATITY